MLYSVIIYVGTYKFDKRKGCLLYTSLEEELDGAQMREYVNLLMEKEVDTCILLNGDGQAECREFKYVAASKTEDARCV